MNQLIRRRTIRSYHPAQRAKLPQMPNQRPRIDIPNHRNLVPVQIQLRRLCRPPARAHLRKFADDQRLDVRPRRFLIIEIRANVPNVRIGQANDLPGITWIGEDFLVSREAGIENYFAAPARDRAGRAAVKYAPVFERKCSRSMQSFRQCVLPASSSYTLETYLVFASVTDSDPK